MRTGNLANHGFSVQKKPLSLNLISIMLPKPKKKSKLKQWLYGCFPPPLCSFSGISVVSFFNENFEHGFARLTLVKGYKKEKYFDQLYITLIGTINRLEL